MAQSLSINKWRSLGWGNPFWELIRYYCSLRGNEQKEFIKELRDKKKNHSDKWWSLLGLTNEIADQVVEYVTYRNNSLASALELLRTEEEAILYCKDNKIEWRITSTKNKDHHQSSKTLIASVTAIAKNVCKTYQESIEPNPQKRCIWYIDNHLHITARNLDGAIPALKDPYIVWEIKEYWGKSKGGSKMSDAVYECHLVGREIREYESKSKHKIFHIVFIDGKDQWNVRKSDLARLIDLYNQGLIDHLFIGKQIEEHWENALKNLIEDKKMR